MKIGNFCEYKNNTYKFSIDIEGNYYIFTSDTLFIDESFDETNKRGMYKKLIQKEDLNIIFSLENYAVWNGIEFDVRKIESNKVLIGTNSRALADSLNFERADKYYYEKWIDREEVEIRERRTELK